MLASVRHTAPVTLTTKADASSLVALRERLRHERTGGVIPGYTDVIIRLVAESLSRHARFNACWQDDGLHIYDGINIAIAVDTEFGLVAPVIRNANTMSLDEISNQSRLLAEMAREKKLTHEQLVGATFTITNLGMYDIDFFTPIINLPQTAILGVGRIMREPVVQGEHVVAGTTIALSLTFDHQANDGASAARWLQELCNRIRGADRVS